MQTVRIVQAAILMLVVAMAASCAPAHEYAGKLFGPRQLAFKDSQQVAVKFLELDSLEADQGWVKTDIAKKDTSATTTPVNDDPVAKTAKPDTRIPDEQGSRNKRKRD